jgi:hypothetical protein
LSLTNQSGDSSADDNRDRGGALGAEMKRQYGRPRSSFFWPRWLNGDAVAYIAAFVLLCVLLLYFFFALTFKYFD